MSDTPNPTPAHPASQAPAAPASPGQATSAAGTRPALSAVDIIAFVCEIFAFGTLALWGFTLWPFPWNIVAGIAAPVAAILAWALFVSPRAVFAVHFEGGLFLANNGYVVLGINNRGSSGYGQTFFTADDGKHGREPLWDIVESKKYLASLGYVDEKKIGIIGGSYGGYMVLAALAFKPEEFAVGVDIFGVSNWVRTLQSIPPYWESFRKSLYKELGDPSKDLENLRAISPLFHTDKIVKPLIVLQGANDPRVIKPESDEIVENIKKRNGVVEYVLFDNEGHGFTKKANEIRAYKSILDFLDRYLKNGDAVSSR